MGEKKQELEKSTITVTATEKKGVSLKLITSDNLYYI